MPRRDSKPDAKEAKGAGKAGKDARPEPKSAPRRARASKPAARAKSARGRARGARAARTVDGAEAKSAAPKRWALRRYLVAGMLVWLPILATIWVVSFMLHIMDRTLLLLPPPYRPEALVGFALPGVGAAVRARDRACSPDFWSPTSSAGSFVVWGEELLNRIPVVRTVYGGVKSFAESVLSQSNSFRKVVMVEYPRAGVWSIGFLTAEDVPEVSERLGEPHAAVYMSAALNADRGLPGHRAAPRR